MALELYQTSKHSRLYREVMPDGSRRGYVTTTLGIMNYESISDSGVFDTLIDTTLNRITNSQLDGYSMTEAGWHYAVQTIDPTLSTAQPNSQSPLGTIGFGGRQGQNWFKFRLSNIGYIHWPTRTLDGIGGAPDYSSELTIDKITRNIGKNPEVPNEIQTTATNINWGNIWTTPCGGEVSIRWGMKAGKMKEEIVLNQAAREWIQINRPPTTPANETYFGFRFELDVSDIPKVWREGILQDWNSADFDDDSGPIQLTDNLDRLLAFMPLDSVYVRGKGGNRPLRKRFFRENNQNYLYVGVRVDQLIGLLPGDLIFDPSMGQENIAANADDGHEAYTGEFYITPAFSDSIFMGLYNNNVNYGGFRFTPNLPQGASLTGGGSEYASLRIYGTDYAASWRLTGTPSLIIRGDDQDNAGAWGNGYVENRPGGTGFTATTANFPFTITTDPGSGGEFQDPTSGDLDVASIIEEIVGRAGWSANNGLRFGIFEDSSPTGSHYIACFDYSDATGQEAVLDAFYTTGGTFQPFFPKFNNTLLRM